MTLVKNAWITLLTFTRADDASITYDFNGENTDILVWDPRLPRRGQARPRMQTHGTNLRRTRYEGLQIDHEGVFGPASSQETVIAERDALVAAIRPDFAASPSDETTIGTLTVKYLGWTEAASGLVTLDDDTLAFGAGDVLTLAYQLQWRCDLPYFTGDDSGDPVLLG